MYRCPLWHHKWGFQFIPWVLKVLKPLQWNSSIDYVSRGRKRGMNWREIWVKACEMLRGATLIEERTQSVRLWLGNWLTLCVCAAGKLKSPVPEEDEEETDPQGDWVAAGASARQLLLWPLAQRTRRQTSAREPAPPNCWPLWPRERERRGGRVGERDQSNCRGWGHQTSQLLSFFFHLIETNSPAIVS